jgi:hypothetical protein
MKTALLIIVPIISAVLIGFFSYVSAYNTANRMERSLVAIQDNNRNILAQYGQKIAEAAQIPAMQRDDLSAVVKTALESRYGQEGSKALFQFIQEQNPQIDSAVYIQLQRIIEAGRNDFAIQQTKMLDQKRIYETSLGSFWQGSWMQFAGYPKINLDEFKIVSTSRADDAFKTGTEEPIKLR